MQVHSTPIAESPEQIYARVYRLLRPETDAPVFRVEFRRFASANSFIRMRQGVVTVRISDLLEGAPAAITEALAFILLAKLFGQAAPAKYRQRYRSYLNRQHMRRTLHLVRSSRGRKRMAPPQGACYDLVEIFEDLNLRFFGGLMARPELGWSLRASRSSLGHYDPSHNCIVISNWLDRPEVPPLVVEYVVYHEMLHLRHPAKYTGTRRQVHTKEFREAENQFPEVNRARELLKHLR